MDRLHETIHEIFDIRKDENGLRLDNENWARIPDGYALNVSPNVNNVTDGGTDLVSLAS
jgi:hypothetical protein